MSTEFIRIVEIDQFTGSPFYDSRLITARIADFSPGTELYNSYSGPGSSYRKPTIKVVGEYESPPMCTTWLVEGPEGGLTVWKYNWDSSG